MLATYLNELGIVRQQDRHLSFLAYLDMVLSFPIMSLTHFIVRIY